jgi:peptide/nickel transport system ATP-binding protein
MQFPHELSGGIRQRICIAIAIANRPRLLIADEPTTALDSTVQASILRTVDELVAAGGMALWLISHDLGVVNQMTRQVAVMRAGQLIEAGETAEVLARPREDYTRTLVAAVPRLIARHGPGQEVTIGSDPLVQMHDVVKIYGPVSSRQVLLDHPGCVLRGVSLAVEKGSCLGIVGESGSGKSTLIKCMLGLVRLTRGKVTVMGNQLTSRGFRDARHLRGHVQMVFQDPFSSLNPRMRIGDIVSEPLIALGVPRNEAFARAMRCLQDVCLSPSDAERWPHQLSGGQRQRVGIARAIVTEPKLIVLDEPVSALDLTVQSSILDLLEILKERLGLTYVLVSHDLGVIARLATDVAVMARGVIVEKGNPVEILSNPKHHITRTLIECSLAHDFG